ncbi:MAG: hypothetical protein GY820_02835 [Gammaproteobacteria bacterium]|nr:hypothetical protein [Gammaproteobacteria bacterium]
MVRRSQDRGRGESVTFRLEEKMVRRVRRIIFFFTAESASRRRWYGGSAISSFFLNFFTADPQKICRKSKFPSIAKVLGLHR